MIGVRWVVCMLTMLVALDALAAPALYRVELDAPPRFRKLLREQLDLYRERGNERMDSAQLAKAVRAAPDRIRELLATEGYVSPTVDSALTEANGATVVYLKVDPGEPAVVDELNLKFSGEVTQPKPYNTGRIAALREAWRLVPGDRFTQTAWERAKRDVLRDLLSKRYPAARIAASKATLDPSMHRADLDVEFDSGPAFVFGELQTDGLERYPRSIIENLSPITAGDPYEQEALYELQQRLQRSGYFHNVFVSAPASVSQEPVAPVIVSVVEAPAKKLSFGVGFSTNTGGRLQVKYRDNNLRSRGWRWRNELKLESKQQLLATELALPTRRDGWYDSAQASLGRADIEGERVRKIQLGVKRGKVDRDIERAVAILYAREWRQVAGASSDQSGALTANYLWTRRAVDDLLYPHSGYLLHAELGGAAEALLSDRTFVRAYSKTSYFHPLGLRDTLILGGELGVVAAASREGIPSQFLFRAGGDQSIRGYAYQSIGVRSGEAIVGGRYLATASIEYQRYFTDTWGAAVFYDIGSASDSLGDLKLYQGAGIGARWRSPVGPLKLDLAYGDRSKKARLHFAVGFAF